MLFRNDLYNCRESLERNQLHSAPNKALVAPISGPNARHSTIVALDCHLGINQIMSSYVFTNLVAMV